MENYTIHKCPKCGSENASLVGGVGFAAGNIPKANNAIWICEDCNETFNIYNKTEEEKE